MFRRLHGGRGSGGRRPDASYLLLLLQLYQQINAIPGPKPPVTLGLILIQVIFFTAPLLNNEAVASFIPFISQGCLSPHAILFKGQWHRLFTSAFLHVDEHHLYYNMASLLWKGTQLEGSMSAARYLVLIAELLVVSHSLVIAASYFLASFGPSEFVDLPFSLCAVGFSAVLFGMKVVLNHQSQGWSQIFGVPIPTRLICWGELVLSSLLFPQASFMGHLCGIIAGWIHVKVTDPMVAAVTHWQRDGRRFRPSQRFSGSGLSGRRCIPRPIPRSIPRPQAVPPTPPPLPAHLNSEQIRAEIRELRMRRFQADNI